MIDRLLCLFRTNSAHRSHFVFTRDRVRHFLFFFSFALPCRVASVVVFSHTGWWRFWALGFFWVRGNSSLHFSMLYSSLFVSIGSCPGLNFKKTQLYTHGIISDRVLCFCNKYKWQHTCIFRVLAFNTLTLRWLPILAGESVNWYTCIIAECVVLIFAVILMKYFERTDLVFKYLQY